MSSTLSIDMRRWDVRLTSFLLMLAAFAVCVIAFRGALFELVHRWSWQEEYSHGFLIPFISAWLLWSRRDALRASVGRPSWAGLVLILLAIVMNIVGELSAIFLLSQLGFVMALFGMLLAFGGYSLLKVAFIPIAFLLFSIPLPYFIDAMLTLRLQLISSELGVFFIRLFGIPVFLDGNVIDMGNYKLQVVEACSGLRYLYPLLSLSFLAAYLFHGPLWQRMLVFLSSIPIAIGMNGFRIGVVGILVDRWGNAMAEGVLHFFEGWVIFLGCALLLAIEMWIFALMSRKRLFDVFYFPRITLKKSAESQKAVWGRLPLAACLTFLVAGGIASHLISDRTEIIPSRVSFAEFPTRIGPWQGRASPLDLATEKFLKVDDYILSDYVRPDGRPVNLYVAFYASQRSGESPHSPIVCIPGGGWAITAVKQVYADGGNSQQPFNRVIIEKGPVKELVYYWFDERGRRIANEYWAKVYLLTDAIVKNRTDGALVRLTTQVFPGETEQDGDRRLQAFMQEAVPKLTSFLPADNTPAPKSLSLAAPFHQL
jgi:exosortase D (VPLPA-CTERM-specific)